jgi:MFS family permease/quinol monooxygenase YgiN
MTSGPILGSTPGGAASTAESTSAWGPLRHRVFRDLWLAALVSNIGTWMQNVAAAWYMTSLSPSPLMIALIQAATSLPVFLVGLPAGAVADILDRRRLLLFTQGWMLAVAGLLALCTFAGLMTPWTLIAFTFALGLGMALNSPTWQAITPEIVPRGDLASAVGLNSLTVNIGRAVGPALGGVLVAASGPAPVFGLNALSFVAVLYVVYRWQRRPTRSPLPAERVIGATRAGLRYIRHAEPLRAILARTGLFMVAGCAFWALLPVVARHELGLDALGYGVLLGCVGVGAIVGAMLLPRLKHRLRLDTVVALASALYAAATVLTGSWRWLPGLWLAMALAGLAWIAVLASLNAAVQTAVPPWVRARALGVYLVVFQGGLGLGSAAWGVIAEHVGTPQALALSAAGLLLGLVAARRWPLSAATTLDLAPSAHWPEPHVDIMPEPEDGPVLVQVEYRIDPTQVHAFIEAIHALANVRRRDGAIEWDIFRDPADSGRHVETFLVESWVEHLRQHERLTMADRAVENRVRHFHTGTIPPAVVHLVAVHRGVN